MRQVILNSSSVFSWLLPSLGKLRLLPLESYHVFIFVNVTFELALFFVTTLFWDGVKGAHYSYFIVHCHTMFDPCPHHSHTSIAEGCNMSICPILLRDSMYLSLSQITSYLDLIFFRNTLANTMSHAHFLTIYTLLSPNYPICWSSSLASQQIPQTITKSLSDPS